jgi:uncharacterized protein (TIRG00374 family)
MASNDTRDQGLTWRTAVKRCLPVALGGIAIYLVLPRLTAVFGAWPRLSTLNPIWYAVAFGSEAVSFTCTLALQRLVLRTASWFTLVTAQLSGNAITNTMPGADALGAAVQFRMLARSGVDTDSTVSGLGVLSLLQVGSLLALPLFALPAILLGTPVKRGLFESALIGIAGFVLFAGGSVLFFGTDRPLQLLGLALQRVWNTVSRKKPPLAGLDERLLHDRDAGKQMLGRSWRRAVLLTTGRLGFDFGCLLCVLRATHSSPSPSLVLLAYAAAGVIGLLPITPGGLGIVEASLSGFLILAGIPAGEAFLAVLAYRIISYWVPTFAGPFAYLAFRHRYGSPRPPSPDKN